LPGESTVSLELPISSSKPIQNSSQQVFSKAKSTMPVAKGHFTARQDKQIIELQIDLSNEPLQFQTAQFFPAARGMIDDAHLPVLNAKDNGKYILLLKLAEGKQPEFLQGVLLLQSASGESQSIDLNLPIEISNTTIAFADDPALAASLKEIMIGSNETDYTLEGGLAVAILFAFLGGVLLNLMPCVFPVISFKILSFVNMAGKSRSYTLLHGSAFSFGVIASFWVFAGLLVLLQAYGHEAGWGFQLKQPIFVGFLTIILFIFALSLFGVFEFGLSLTNAAGNAQQKVGSSSMIGSFLSGVLATAVATPCTGPFMAAALGYAATLPALGSFLIFTSLGIGMAAPYFLLSAFPQLLRFLPKPGPWMVVFKQIMAFLLIATVLWLVNVFASETGEFGTNLMLISLFVVSVGCWIYGLCCSPVNSQRSKRLGMLFTGLCLLISGYLVTFAGPAGLGNNTEMVKKYGDWENFTAERFEELRKAGTPVFIDFTATWCLICQANHWMLSTDNVEKKFDEMGVVKMKADWTRHDPVITALLRKFGRNGVPLYVLYSSDHSQPPQVLPQVLTPGIVIEALDKLETPVANH
jgi:thiol:disulfide interchange protein DsbD